jgi:hypothetical protein
MSIENHDILFERQVSLTESDPGFVEIMIDDLAALVSVKELQEALNYCNRSSNTSSSSNTSNRKDDVIAKELWKEIYLEERERVRTSTDAADHANKAVEEFYKTFEVAMSIIIFCILIYPIVVGFINPEYLAIKELLGAL